MDSGPSLCAATGEANDPRSRGGRRRAAPRRPLVFAIARRLEFTWDTCWAAIQYATRTKIAGPGGVKGLSTYRAKGHIWRPSKIPLIDKTVTLTAELNSDQNACLHARLLDAVHERSGKIDADLTRRAGHKYYGHRGSFNRCSEYCRDFP